jgi:hypothetical protein
MPYHLDVTHSCSLHPCRVRPNPPAQRRFTNQELARPAHKVMIRQAVVTLLPTRIERGRSIFTAMPSRSESSWQRSHTRDITTEEATEPTGKTERRNETDGWKRSYLRR